MNLGELGLQAPNISRTPNGLPKSLHQLDSKLFNAEDTIAATGCDVNRLRLWVEDMAILLEAGCLPSQEELSELRCLGRSLAAATANALEDLRDARSQLRERARRRLSGAQVIPLRRSEDAAPEQGT